MSVEFKDYSVQVKGALSDAGKQWLMEAVLYNCFRLLLNEKS